LYLIKKKLKLIILQAKEHFSYYNDEWIFTKNECLLLYI
jgi:hypothetical protein